MDDAPSHSSSHHSPQQSDSDSVLVAMGSASGALQRFAQHSGEILAAFDRAAGMRETGATHRQIAEAEPLFVDFSTGPFRELADALSALRRTQARALYSEGMTMAQLGRVLGVTRQRIAVLLGSKAKSAD